MNSPLVYAINRPASDCQGNAVYIGPTAVSFAMLPDPSPTQAQAARIPASEADRLKAWRTQSRSWLHGHKGQPYINPMHPDRSF